MLTCHDVARYFLSLVNAEEGDLMSNLKLQKLVYYAQGFHLALNGAPLFPEPIEAWTHGPVVPELYHSFKEYGGGPIPTVTDLDFSRYSPEVRELLDEVYSVYGQYSAWRLAEMTHNEPPWQRAAEARGVIAHDVMREHFATLLING